MPIETLDDILEELADKIGIYGTERNEWVIITKERILFAVSVELIRLLNRGHPLLG